MYTVVNTDVTVCNEIRDVSNFATNSTMLAVILFCLVVSKSIARDDTCCVYDTV